MQETPASYPVPPVIESFTYDSGKPGPTFVVTGAVHGNEKSGTAAILRLKDKLDSGALKLEAGRLIMIPVSNPGAYAANKRFLERNLNRNFYAKPPEERKLYEDHLDHQIIAVLDKADYLLDLHSYEAGGPPFLFIGGHDAKEKEFAEALGVTRNFVWDWQNAFAASSISQKDSQSATNYLRNKGVPALTFEAGQHDDPANIDRCYTAVMRGMGHLKLVPESVVTQELGNAAPAEGEGHFAKMVTVIRNEPTKLARAFRHFEPVEKGEVLAFRENGETITAPAKGYAILPNPKAAKGAEILYLGIDEEPKPAPRP